MRTKTTLILTLLLTALLVSWSFAEKERERRIIHLGPVQITPERLAELQAEKQRSLQPKSPLDGVWDGPEWGVVQLKRIEDGSIHGTYSDSHRHAETKIRLRWSHTTRRFEGVWSEGVWRHGRISVRLLPDGRTLRGAYTTDESSALNPGQPALADLEWIRR